MFPTLEAKIEEARRKGERSVPTLLGLLSRAIYAFEHGNLELARDIENKALNEY